MKILDFILKMLYSILYTICKTWKGKLNMLKKLSEVLNGFSKQILALERINSQRCMGKDLDTTKTIFENKR